MSEEAAVVEVKASERPHPTKEEKHATAERVQARKMRQVEDPSSIVLDPKSRECHVLVRVMFVFNRAVVKIRMKAGLSIPTDKVDESLRQAEEFNQRLVLLTGMLSEMSSNPYGTGSYQYETPEMKRLLAAKRSSYVFIPGTEESKKVAMHIKRIDPLLQYIRKTCTDFERAAAPINRAIQTVIDFNSLTQQLTKTARLKYEYTKGLLALENAIAPKRVSAAESAVE